MSLCPKCGAAMEDREIGRLPAERCPECRGLWWDHVALDAALGRLDDARVSMRIQQFMQGPFSADTDFPCPNCSLRTLKSVVHEGIEIDWCPDCRGIYLDDKELEALTSWRKAKIGTTDSGVLGTIGEIGVEGLELVVALLLGVLDA
jgi:Zn-finger nucleic acid-binding protein